MTWRNGHAGKQAQRRQHIAGAANAGYPRAALTWTYAAAELLPRPRPPPPRPPIPREGLPAPAFPRPRPLDLPALPGPPVAAFGALACFLLLSRLMSSSRGSARSGLGASSACRWPCEPNACSSINQPTHHSSQQQNALAQQNTHKRREPSSTVVCCIRQCAVDL